MKIKFIKNKYRSLLLVLFLVLGSFLIGNFVWAGTFAGAAVAKILGWIMMAILYFLGKLLGVLVGVLLWIAQYNDFITSPAVTNGWIIMRDLCNMFFILILLIIAFATILRRESYSIKTLLPKLLIMAVLINFSKTICGIFIDFAQVIMLTFVNSFAAIGGGNLMSMLGIDKITKIDANSGEIDDLAVVGAYMLALLYVVISIVVITTMIAMLVMRMIMIWIYVVLSPAAYLLAAFPAGQKYSAQWWEEFSKNLIVGPVLAFFIWLSFVSATGSATSNGLVNVKSESYYPSASETAGGSQESVVKFIVSIGMLVGGLMVAQQLGGAAGKLAGKGMTALQSGKQLAMKGIGRATGVSYVADTAKAYMAMRKSSRDTRIREGAGKLAGGIGLIKKNTVGLMGKAGTKAWGAFGRNQAATLDQKYKNKEDMEFGGHEYKFDDVAKKWKKTVKGGRHVETFSTEEEFKNKDLAERTTKLNKYQSRANLAGRMGLAVGGATLGAMAAPAFLGMTAAVAAGAYGAAVGGVGVPALEKMVREAGEEDFNLASDFKNKKVKEEEDGISTGDTGKIIATMDDRTRSEFTRVAAILTAMNQKLLSPNEVLARKEQVSTEMKNDPKIMAKFEALAQKNYPLATNLFTDMNSGDASKKAKAKEQVQNNYADGTYSLKGMDLGSIEKSIEQLVLGLKASTFMSQTKDLPDAKKKGIIAALEKHAATPAGTPGNYEAKEKLAFLTDIEKAFGPGKATNGSEKQKFTQKLTVEQYNEILTKGDDKQVTSLRAAIGGDINNLSDTMKRASTAQAKANRTDLGV